MITLSALTFMRLVLYYSDVGIRLTGSNETFAGRVEVLSYGVWGRIDGSSSWDRTEAEVVCRQLGFPGVVTALKYSPFGEGSGPVLMSNVRCIGNEKTLKQCQYNDWLRTYVNQNSEAGVICKTPEVNTAVRDISIRLQGSTIPNAGRVEVLYAGIWGAISGTNWDVHDATVVCRQLGYKAGAEIALANGVYGPVSGPVWLTNLQCSGSEANVMSCSHDVIGNKSETQNRWNVASVTCKNLSHANRMLVRLRGSSSPNMGRVEVNYAGKWGLIYRSGWDIKDAMVVCRQLGYTTALLAGSKLFCSIALTTLFQNFRCYGNESALDQCIWDFTSYTRLGSYCANVMCSDGSADSGFDIRLTNSSVRHAGRIELRIHGIWGTLHSYDFYIRYINFDGVICRQLNFSDSVLLVGRAAFGSGTGPQWYETWDIDCLGYKSNLQNCTYYSQPRLTISNHEDDLSVICKPSAAQANDFKVRLTGSSFNFSGKIEVMYYGVWGGIFGGGSIDINVGHVVCRQLGYPGADEIFQYAAFGPLKGLLWIGRIRCVGNESNISECKVTTWEDPTIDYWIRRYYQDPYYAASVLCIQANYNSFQMLDVRFAGAPISNAGRVEVFYAGNWGTVTSWGWDINAAHVVCRQLGYPASISYGYNNQFGSSTGPRWFTNLRCFGNETNLGECTKDVSGYPSRGSSAATALCKLPYQADISTKCSKMKCRHQGTCIDTGGGAVCNCTEGFTGIHCEKSLSNPCQDSPCENGGKCFSSKSSYICSCPDGRSGLRCEKRTTITMRPCQSHPCTNNAFCHDNETHYSCVIHKAENSTSLATSNGSSQKQNGSTTSKTTQYIIALSILASLALLLIAAVVYLIFQNRRLSKPRHRNQQAAFRNVAFRSDQEETHYCNEIDLGSGTSHSSMPMKDNTNPLYEISPSIEEKATSRPLPPIPPPPNAARMNPKAARKKANRRNGGVKPRGATEGPRRATNGAEEHYMALSKESNSTPLRNIAADREPNSNDYMSLSKNRQRDISHS